MQNTTVPFTLIRVADRMRQDHGDLDELARSIDEIGLICPLTVEETPEGDYNLLAGGRRYGAICLLRDQCFELVDPPEEIPFDQVPVFIKYNLASSQRKLIELEENLRRKEMTWQEQAVGIAQAHAEHQRDAWAQGSEWICKQTGDMLGFSHSHVVNANKLAEFLLKGDEEIIKCASATDAMAILSRRKQRELEKHMADIKKAALALKKSNKELPAVAIVDQNTGETQTTEPLSSVLSEESLDRYNRACEIVLHEDSHRWMAAQPSESVDGIYTDIPYGIDVNNLSLKQIHETKTEHDRNENIHLFEGFLQHAGRILKPESFIVFWYDVEHTTTLIQYAYAAGLRVQRWPLHAKKPIAKNEAAGYNSTKDYESVLVFAKTGAALNEKCSTSWIPWEWADGERAQYAHAFCKPHSANEFLLKTFFKPGSRILDPYCGEGSLALSGLRLGYDFLGIDKVEHHVIRARNHVERLLS